MPTAYACSLLPYSTLAAPIYLKDKTVPSCLNLGSSSSSNGGGGGNNLTIFVSQSISSSTLAGVWYYSAPNVFTSLFINDVAAFLGVFPSAITVSTPPEIPLYGTPQYYPLVLNFSPLFVLSSLVGPFISYINMLFR